MPSAIVMNGTSAGSVPVPGINGFSLFADVNNNGSPTIKLPNGTLQALGILPPGGCGGCGGCGGGGGCTCTEVANCIDTDSLVQNSLTTFNNNYYSSVATLGGLSDVDLTGLIVGNGISWDGANWTPVALAGGTDELVKVTANDTTPGYLFDKVVAGVNNNIVLTELNDGADEDLEVALNTTLTNMVSIDVDDLTVTNSATFDGATVDIQNGSTFNVDGTSTTNFNGGAVNYTNNTITNVGVTETYDVTSSVIYNNAVTFNVAPTGLTPTQETPAGVINSVNLAFTIAGTPTGGVIQLHVNGVYQHPTVDYTLVGSAITMAAGNAPTTGSVMTADYLS